MGEIWSNHVSYLSKENSFIHISPLRQSHCLPKSLETKFAWDMFHANVFTAHLSVSWEGETKPALWCDQLLAWVRPLLSSWWPWESVWGASESVASSPSPAGDSHESGGAGGEQAESHHTRAQCLEADKLKWVHHPHFFTWLLTAFTYLRCMCMCVWPIYGKPHINYLKLRLPLSGRDLSLSEVEKKHPVEGEMPASRRGCIMGTFSIHYGTLLLKYIHIWSRIGNILT